MIRALNTENGAVRFVIEAPSAEIAKRMEPLRAAAEETARDVPGVTSASVVLSAPTAQKAPPQMKVGGHAKQQEGPMRPPGVKSLIAVGSGKGGVGKSTVASNLAVALQRAGKTVGLLDADIHGPSQPRMFGLTKRAASPDGKTIIPLEAHGVKVMSIGSMLDERKAVVWRGPMLMGALQQMMMQVEWGELDVMVVDLPPGTGDVQLSLCQKSEVTGALVVSTPQDVALLDARKGIDMFQQLKVPVLGLIENMSTHICSNCGHEEHIFGHGGVRAEAEKLGVPLLAEIPLHLDIRLASDGGAPIVVTRPESAQAQAFRQLARDLVARGLAADMVIGNNVLAHVPDINDFVGGLAAVLKP